MGMSAEATRTRALVYVCAYRHHGGPIDVAASMERWNPRFQNSVSITELDCAAFAGTRKFDNWAQLEGTTRTT
jgi:hypothetical protein